MDRPDLPLNALRTFEVAARQGNFTRAAIELRVTQAAVSHQIARLEDLLGTTLFLRAPGGLVLTEDGAALFPVMEHSLNAMARALERLDGRHHVEVIRLGVVTTFALGWLMPRLPGFHRLHPAIDLRLSTHNNRVEIAREGLDMAIRFGTGDWSGQQAIPLMQAPMAPLCSPQLAADLRQPADLAAQVLLRSYRGNEWNLWCDAAGIPCPALEGPMLDSSIALADLAMRGDGVALLPVAMFARQIAAGDLVQPFDTQVSIGGYWLTYPAGRRLSPGQQALADWMQPQATPAGPRAGS